MVEWVKLTLGPLANNVYLLGEQEGGDAVVIDPSYESEVVLSKAEEKGWTLRQIWLTHAHFDHIAGAGRIAQAFDPPLPVGLHPADRDWYAHEGGAGQFGMSVSGLPVPTIWFEHGDSLGLHTSDHPVVTVRHAPGHSPGHVMFYCSAIKVLFCGDVIFREGIGRTDLPGGNWETLLNSIREEVLILPDETLLLPGHGPESTVGYECQHNPFLKNLDR